MTRPHASTDHDRLPISGAGLVHETILIEGRRVPLWRADTGRIVGGFTGRQGGLSRGPYASLNLSTKTGDSASPVARNRELAVRAATGTAALASTIEQVHGGEVVRAATPGSCPEADGHWTDEPGRPLTVLAADCVPVLLAGPGTVGIAHAGWRGLVAGVVERTAEACGADEAWIGPAIGPCCFEVGSEVTAAFGERFGDDVVPDERHVDLWSAVEAAAAAAGIRTMHTLRVCTHHHPELLFSHRRDEGRTGRQGAIAMLPERP